MRRIPGTLLGALLVFAAAVALASSSSFAANGPAMTCSVSDGVMGINVHDWGTSSAFWVTRHGNALLARDTASGRPETIACGGPTATVESVDRVVVRESRPPGTEEEPSTSNFRVDMRNGVFSPGATRESNGRSEIEVLLDLPRGIVSAAAPSARHRLEFGVKHRDLGLDMNRDGDLDVEFRRPLYLDVFAGPGDNLIDARTGAKQIQPRRPRLFIWGRGGDDRILGGGERDQLIAGSGADVLIGTYGGTQLDGGPGPDKLIAGPESTLIQGKGGNDRLDARNRHNDWVSCGPGDHDHARADRHEEYMGGCEHAPSVRSRF